MTVVSRLHASYLPLQNFPTVLPARSPTWLYHDGSSASCSVLGLPLIQSWQTAVEGRGLYFSLKKVASPAMLSAGSNLHDRLQPKNKDGLAGGKQRKQVTDGHYQIEPQSGDRLMSTENLLTLDDLAVRIRSTAKTVANRYYRAPEDFPPVLKVPGCRGPRFRPQDVDVWISGLAGKTENRSTKLPLSVPPPSDHAAAKRPRGRPRLASVAQRQKVQSGHQKTGDPARSQTGPRWPLPGLNADDTPILAEGGAK